MRRVERVRANEFQSAYVLALLKDIINVTEFGTLSDIQRSAGPQTDADTLSRATETDREKVRTREY